MTEADCSRSKSMRVLVAEASVVPLGAEVREKARGGALAQPVG
jgi:hypothetical protein